MSLTLSCTCFLILFGISCCQVTHPCIHARARARTQRNINTHIRAHARTHRQRETRTYAHTCARARKQTNTQAHTHTHKDICEYWRCLLLVLDKPWRSNLHVLYLTGELFTFKQHFHALLSKSVHIHLLVRKQYSVTKNTQRSVEHKITKTSAYNRLAKV